MQSLTMPNPLRLDVNGRTAGTTHFPMLGIACTVAGTVLAVGFIPQDPEPRGALFLSSIVMAAGLAIAPVAAAIRDPKSFLRAEHLLALAPVYWLLMDLIQGTYSMGTVQRGHIGRAFIAIGLFVVAIWISACFRDWRVPGFIGRTASREFSGNTYFSLLVIAFVLGMLIFAIPCNFNPVDMFYYAGQMRWNAPWGRGQFGGWDAFLDHLQYFGYLLPPLTVIVGRRVGWRNWRTPLSIVMTLVISLFLAQNGGRRIIGVMFGTAILLWVLTQKQFRAKHIIPVVIAAGILLAAMQVMLQYRSVGLAAMTNPDDQTLTVFEEGSLRVDDNFYRLCQTIQLIPESHPFVYQQYFIYVLVRPIPRIFWPGKPEDPGFDLAGALGDQNVSYSTSVVGELYTSAGFIGILLGGLLYGRIASMTNQLLTQSMTLGGYLIYSAMTMALFSGVRSMLELVLMNYVVLAWFGLSWVYVHIKRRRERRLLGAMRPSFGRRLRA
ncbi:MAG TPA: oligosaccharide repeat unit polymerase [Blastocatellia bacterium]